MPSDGEEGLVDRLAKKLFASSSSPLSEFADRQRAERLASCRQLETILNACQAESRIGLKHTLDAHVLTSDDTTVTTTESGIKIARFFNWGSPHADPNNNQASDRVDASTEDKPSDAVKSIYSQGCHKETHELWACRALALGCGNYLSDLRRCWNENCQVKALRKSTDGSSEIIYEDNNINRGADKCQEIQQNMAKCVTKHASELAERIEARKNTKSN